MPITSAQLEKRKNHLGSSDIAPLLGLDERRNRYDLWLEKTGKLVPEKETENDPKAAGKILEPAVLDWAETQLGKVTRNQFRSAKDRGIPIAVNIDAIVNDSGVPVEVKTSGLYGFTNDVWGEANTDQVPDRIILQAHAHMLPTDAEVCFVPVFIAFRGFVMFQVPRDPQIIDVIANEATDFWSSNVLADVPPENVLPNPTVIRRVRREANKTVDLSYKLIEEWEAAKAIESAAKKNKEAALSAILTVLGDAEAGQTEQGLFTYFESSRTGYVVQPTTFRTARFKRAK